MVKHRASDDKVADLCSILDLTMCRCILGKDILHLFSNGAKQSPGCGDPA